MRRRRPTSRTTVDTTTPPAVELRLYVSLSSAASARAIRNAQRILDRYAATAVTLTVCDLSADASCGDRDRVTFTPTLCVQASDRSLSILGDLSDESALVDLLGSHGVRPRHGHR